MSRYYDKKQLKVYNQKETLLVQITDLIDGDTVYCEQLQAQIRLVGIETFETTRGRRLQNQEFLTGITAEVIKAMGKMAMDCLNVALGNGLVWFEYAGIDKYCRYTGYLHTTEGKIEHKYKTNTNSGFDVGEYLIQHGYAYVERDSTFYKSAIYYTLS